MQKILIVEDDERLAHYLSSHVEKYGYRVKKVADFSKVLDTFIAYEPHLVLLDINLPMYDGFYWCRQIRQRSTCPVIFISARTGEMDQIMALENGGDDFLTKPFSPDIVLAKVRSHLRRAYGEYAAIVTERVVEQAGLKLYVERLELHYGSNEVALTKNEATIMELLLERYPRITGRTDLLEKLWDDETFVDENTLNVNIARVRKKLVELGVADGIETVRGVGYRLQLP
ncbi:MAG TPA: response regulator transcription factor [Pseudogracilibacillus sp.]|nr:response regulator transcription factor [Pseudogracilibacillus sp.]